MKRRIVYMNDPVTQEYVAHPCETVNLGAGDCEDQSILMLSMLESIGVDSKFVWIKEKHMFIAADYNDFKNLCNLTRCTDCLGFEDNGKMWLVIDPVMPCIGITDFNYIDYRNSLNWDWKYQTVVFDNEEILETESEKISEGSEETGPVAYGCNYKIYNLNYSDQMVSFAIANNADKNISSVSIELSYRGYRKFFNLDITLEPGSIKNIGLNTYIDKKPNIFSMETNLCSDKITMEFKQIASRYI